MKYTGLNPDEFTILFSFFERLTGLRPGTTAAEACCLYGSGIPTGGKGVEDEGGDVYDAQYKRSERTC